MSDGGDAPIPFGFVEWFRPGEYDRVQAAITGMRSIGACYVRTHISWAAYHTEKGRAWYDWLIPVLSRDLDLLPCIHYTPPSLSRTGRSSGPPHRLKDFPDFVDHLLTHYGTHFRHVELWNEPNNLLDWDWRVDPDWLLFCEMIGAAAHWTLKRGWKPVLGGPCPLDLNWLRLMGQRGILGTISAIGFHGFPGTWDSEAAGWRGYSTHLKSMRSVLEEYNSTAEIWITEAGYSTWRHDEMTQVEQFRLALAAPAKRLYWYGWQDIPRSVPVQQGVYFDPRHYHLGVTDAAGRPKMLHRQLKAGGPAALSRPAISSTTRIPRGRAPLVIFGGAGFIGANLADSLMRDGEDVIVFDNLSRPGVERNLAWLTSRHGARLHFVAGDIRDPEAIAAVVKRARAIFHLAAQVAVTASLADPQEDFNVNMQGTLNILEAVRRLAPSTPLIFASTNKVYGNLAEIDMQEAEDRYYPADPNLHRMGVDETQPLSFCTPYGCSKGSADQYVLDYAHSFGLKTVVLRKSCVYGPRQFGTEDQGWLAHFLIRALHDEPIVIFGNGKQVRDVLHVTDAVAAYRSALQNIAALSGCAFNIGGGVGNAVSLKAVLAEIAVVTNRSVRVTHADRRTGDQLYFVANTQKFMDAVGWRPMIGWRDGVRDLADWLSADLQLPVLRSHPIRRGALV